MSSKALSRTGWAILAAASLWGGPAEACFTSDGESALIHSARPRILPAGMIVAEVEFESTDIPDLYGKGMRVRVTKMIQGDGRLRALIARPAFMSSCSRPFANGSAGIIVAIPRGWEEGMLVVDPVEVPRGSGFMVPDGWQLPPGEAEKVWLR